MMLLQRLTSTDAPPAVILIRLIVGGVFLSEGIPKFLFPEALGVGRFVKIVIPAALSTCLHRCLHKSKRKEISLIVFFRQLRQNS